MGAMLRLNTSLRALDVSHNRLTPLAIAALCRTALEFGLVQNLVRIQLSPVPRGYRSAIGL